MTSKVTDVIKLNLSINLIYFWTAINPKANHSIPLDKTNPRFFIYLMSGREKRILIYLTATELYFSCFIGKS